MSEKNEKYGIGGMGWIPDRPDFRDYTSENEKIAPMLALTGVAAVPSALPATKDLRAWCSPIENQLNLGSCTAHAGIGLVEYFERRAFGNYLDASRLFLYKTTRNLMHWTGDTGAYLRNTMGSLVLFGAPPEEYCPYIVANFDIEPSAFLYAFGQSYKAISYFRLDPPGTAKNVLLNSIKAYIANGIPSMFGFTVYSSISQASANGKIPYPYAGESVLGGHAIDAVGYDDNLTIQNTHPGASPTKGALLIRNSWGTGWGMAGYGWLPYDYVLKGLAVDWWSLLKLDWVNVGVFTM